MPTPTEFPWDHLRTPGEIHGRVVDPSGYVPPDGDAAYVLGSDEAGYTAFASWNEAAIVSSIITQDMAPLAADKILRMKGRVRGVQRMPAISDVGPWNVADASTLIVQIDEGEDPQTITFDAADFADPLNVREWELRDAINAQLAGGEARITGNEEVTIWSDRKGLGSRVIPSGGTAAAALGFVELAWAFSAIVDDCAYIQIPILPGEERDISDVALNLVGAGSPVAGFGLVLIQLTEVAP